MTTSSTKAQSKSFLGTARRFIMIGFTLFTLLFISLLFNHNKLTLGIANHYLNEYNTKINTLDWNAASLTHWQIPVLNLSINDTLITLYQVDIRLNEEQPFSSFIDLDTKLIQAISFDKITVALGHNFVLDRNKSVDNQGPTFALDLKALPNIDIGQIILTLNNKIDSEENQHEDLDIRLNHLSLNQQRQLSSELLVNNLSLFSIEANLGQDNWQANTRVDLAVLQSLLDQLTRLPIQDQALTPLIEQYSQLRQHLHFDGQVHSDIKLSLRSAILKSDHSWQSAKIQFPSINKLQLAPYRIETRPKNATSTSKTANAKEKLNQIDANISGHIADLNFELKPFSITSELNQKTLQQLSTLVFNSSTSSSKAANIKSNNQDEGVTANVTSNVQLKFILALDNGLMYKLNPQQLDIKKLSLDTHLMTTMPSESLSVNAKKTRADNQIITNQLTFDKLVIKNTAKPNSQDNNAVLSISSLFTFDSVTGDLSHLKKFINSRILPPKLAADLSKKLFPPTLSFTEISAHTSGNISANTAENHQLIVRLDTGVRIKVKTITSKAALNPFSLQNALLTTSSPLLLNRSLTPKQTHKTAKQYNNSYQLTFPSLKLKLEDLTFNQFQTDYEDSWQLGKAEIDLVRSQQWEFSSTSEKPFSSVLQQVLGTPWKNQANWQLQQLSMTRHNASKRFNAYQNILNIEQANMQQDLSWNSKKLSSNEHWQLSDLALNSTHTVSINKPQSDKKEAKYNSEENRYLRPEKIIKSVTGHIQVGQNSANIIDSLQQNIPLLADKLIELDIQGEMSSSLHYQLKPTQSDYSLSAQLNSQLTQAQGSFRGTYFSGVDFYAQCTLNDQLISQASSTNSFPLECEKLSIEAEQFNPGILIRDLKIEGKLTSQEQHKSQKTQSIDTVPPPLKSENVQLLDLNAKGSVLNGELLVPKFRINPKGKSSAYIMLQAIDLAALLRVQPQVGIYADGIFDAVLPLEISQGTASIEGGQLTARAPGGLIQVQDNPAILQMRQSQPHLDFAFSALEHLNYTQLSSSLDMQKTGDAILKVNIQGKSNAIERPIHLNYSHEENMLQLLKSLQIGDTLQGQIEESMQ